MDRFKNPTHYEEICRMCGGSDCEPVELNGCDWDAVWSCEV